MGSECASGVCDAQTGACPAEADVIYMAPNGSGSQCTKAQPCGTFASALPLVAGTRTTISMAPGSYSEAVSISGKTVTIIGDGAELTRTTVGDVMDISGEPTSVTIEGIRVHDGPGSVGDGIKCSQTGSTMPALSVVRARIDTNGGKGINATSCEVTISRSVIRGNSLGGVALASSSFTIRNNFISNNGGGTSFFGGVQLSQVSAANTHVFEFNTVAANNGPTDVITGVACSSVITPVSLPNNIVYANIASGSGTQVGGSNCTWSYSDIGPQNQSGTGNINADPVFVNAGQGDFHLMKTSPAKDVADPAATLNVDFDGDSRPQGPRSDMGADEVLP